MSGNTSNGINGNNLFSFLYRTRVKAAKGNVTIVNLSLLFSVLSLLLAPWVVVIGVIVALVLGYRFSFEKNAADFGGTFQSVVKDAAGNVKEAVESFSKHTGNDAEG